MILCPDIRLRRKLRKQGIALEQRSPTYQRGRHRSSSFYETPESIAVEGILEWIGHWVNSGVRARMLAEDLKAIKEEVRLL